MNKPVVFTLSQDFIPFFVLVIFFRRGSIKEEAKMSTFMRTHKLTVMNTPTVFAKDFNMSEPHAVHLYSRVIARILKEGLCPNCGFHPDVELSIAAVKKLDCNISRERDYMMFITGHLIDDRFYWTNLLAGTTEEELNLPEYELIDLIKGALVNALSAGRAPMN